MQETKFITILARIATIVAVMMYVSYFPQLEANLSGGPKSDWLQPMVAGINCTLWVIYALYKRQRDWPVALANAPGIFFGFATSVTALL